MKTRSPTTSLDLRGTSPGHGYNALFRAFHLLPSGESLEFVTDQDPGPFHIGYQLDFPDQPAWTWLESGPAVWRVALSKTQAATEKSGGSVCCGSCSCS